MDDPSPARRGGPHHLVNARTHGLETFSGVGAVPPYAILSHTWGPEEGSYADWGAGARRDSKGYFKVLGACERAMLDGVDYVWVDTCCIDKRHNAELSEAINSMFHWYRGAEVCYVLLSDLTLDTASAAPEQSEGGGEVEEEEADFRHVMTTHEEKQFKDSRYFKRGWTLQEMLAATEVLFFAADGTYLGDLRKLAALVSEATGIDAMLLSGERSLDDFSIPQKLSWASKRETTRLEDRAYSLLGILKVSLDLRYGEGERAFVRLQKEILKQPKGLHVLAWNVPGRSSRCGLLAASPADFATSHDVVADSSTTSEFEFWETNMGLKGSLPVLERSTSEEGTTSEHLLPLDCHFSNCPEKTLALRVRRCVASSSENDFAVVVEGCQDRPGDASSRLGEIHFDDYADVRSESATLLWDGANRSTAPLVSQTSARNNVDKSVMDNAEGRFSSPAWDGPAQPPFLPNNISFTRDVHHSHTQHLIAEQISRQRTSQDPSRAQVGIENSRLEPSIAAEDRVSAASTEADSLAGIATQFDTHGSHDADREPMGRWLADQADAFPFSLSVPDTFSRMTSRGEGRDESMRSERRPQANVAELEDTGQADSPKSPDRSSDHGSGGDSTHEDEDSDKLAARPDKADKDPDASSISGTPERDSLHRSTAVAASSSTSRLDAGDTIARAKRDSRSRTSGKVSPAYTPKLRVNPSRSPRACDLQ